MVQTNWVVNELQRMHPSLEIEIGEQLFVCVFLG